MTKQKDYKKYWVLALLMLNSGLSFYCMGSSLGLLLPTLVEEMSLTTTQVGALAGAIPLGALFFSFISGFILDKFKVKKVMVVTMIALGIAIISRRFASDFSLLYVVFLINGAIHALLLPANNKVSTYWFGKKDIFFVTSLIVFAQGAFGVLGYLTFIPLSNLLGGWRMIYTAFGIMFLVLSFIWIIFVPSKSDDENELNKDMALDVEGHDLLKGLKQVFSSKQVWLVLLSNLFYFGTINVWMSLAPTIYIGHGLEKQSAAFITSLVSFGSTAGYLICPLISNKVGLRKPFIGTAMIISALAQAVALFFPVNIVVTGALIVLGGFMHGWAVAGPQGFLLESEEVGGLNAGVAISANFVFSKLSAVLYPILYASLISKGSFSSTSSLATATAIGAIGGFFIFMARETGPRAAARAVAKESKEKAVVQ